jgi:hypothetical protein
MSQQASASSYISEDDAAFVKTAISGNWQMQLQTQPAQSPDTNTLDLAFFRALQSAQWDHGFAIDIHGLIMQVIRIWPPED